MLDTYIERAREEAPEDTQFIRFYWDGVSHYPSNPRFYKRVDGDLYHTLDGEWFKSTHNTLDTLLDDPHAFLINIGRK